MILDYFKFNDKEAKEDYDGLCQANYNIWYFKNVITRERKYSTLDVGDVLIKLRDGIPVRKFRKNSDVYQKFIVVYKDEYNLIFIKPIKVNGQLGRMFCLNTSTCDYDYDPKYLESKMLDFDYNPAADILANGKYSKLISHE